MGLNLLFCDLPGNLLAALSFPLSAGDYFANKRQDTEDRLEDAKEGVQLFLSLRGRDARDVFHDLVNEGDRFIVLWGARQIDNGERHYVVELLTRTTGEPNPYGTTPFAIAPHVEADSLIER